MGISSVLVRPPSIDPEAVKRRFTLTIDTDLYPAFANFMISCQMQTGQEPEAARALLRMALAAAPEDGMVQSGMARAYNEVQVWAFTRFRSALSEIRNELGEAIKAQSPNGARVP